MPTCRPGHAMFFGNQCVKLCADGSWPAGTTRDSAQERTDEPMCFPD